MAMGRRTRAASGFVADFQSFISKGNFVDLAVGVILGAAFGKIIGSLVDDLITPVILSPALAAAGVDKIENLTYNGIKYGVFLGAILNFLVIGFCLFLLVRAYEKFKRQEEVVAEAAPPDPMLETQQNLTITLERLTQVLESK